MSKAISVHTKQLIYCLVPVPSSKGNAVPKSLSESAGSASLVYCLRVEANGTERNPVD